MKIILLIFIAINLAGYLIGSTKEIQNLIRHPNLILISADDPGGRLYPFRYAIETATSNFLTPHCEQKCGSPILPADKRDKR